MRGRAGDEVRAGKVRVQSGCRCWDSVCRSCAEPVPPSASRRGEAVKGLHWRREAERASLTVRVSFGACGIAVKERREGGTD